ncbi:hypothetical protein HPB52_000470 [Rhipicephalus sanguineus]|uniref:Uncharacterized protein n=1 Tax=Rhipicephalus sanguineus TaxID=34632 RepID=A0A9D4PUJ8_RHISA|nr:hypothetical protein HPB52_000470 [Rhipicephalus sanguineus]
MTEKIWKIPARRELGTPYLIAIRAAPASPRNPLHLKSSRTHARDKRLAPVWFLPVSPHASDACKLAAAGTSVPRILREIVIDVSIGGRRFLDAWEPPGCMAAAPHQLAPPRCSLCGFALAFGSALTIHPVSAEKRALGTPTPMLSACWPACRWPGFRITLSMVRLFFRSQKAPSWAHDYGTLLYLPAGAAAWLSSRCSPFVFVVSASPPLHLRKQDEEALQVIVRKIVKRALGLPVNTSNKRLLDLGMANTFRKLREVHVTNQGTRLSKTVAGRRLYWLAYASNKQTSR